MLIAVICMIFAVITVVSVSGLLRNYVSAEMSNRAEDASKLVEQQINLYCTGGGHRQQRGRKDDELERPEECAGQGSGENRL